MNVSSTEYWGSLVSRVEYYEEWDEYIQQTCSSTCCCDKDGNNCQTYTYDCSYVSNHSPYWQIVTTAGEKIKISEREYDKIKAKFGNSTFQDLDRDYHRIDGDMYFSSWDGVRETSVSVTTQHSYENRIKASDKSIFNYKIVTPEHIKQYDLKEYPPITEKYIMDDIIGYKGADFAVANQNLQYLNGLLGAKKQVKVLILIYKNQPREAALYQEWLWCGGNKNEFIVCIGIDNQNNVKWGKTISWTTNELLKVEVNGYIQKQEKLSLIPLTDYLTVKIAKDFQRRSFEEFDYLTVEPSTFAIITTFILTILINLGLGYWIINNEYDESRSQPYSPRNFYRRY